MGDDRFGPNTAEVEAFLDRLRRLTPAEWEKVLEASPSLGALPELEVKEAPEYFQAVQEATRLAKSNVFPESEAAFYDAMRTAQLVASASTVWRQTTPEPANAALGEGARLPPDAEAEELDRTVATAYEDESSRRVTNACMVAVGGLVIRPWLDAATFDRLTAPFRS